MTGAKRIGVLGGTFDPIHQGHVATAELAGQALALDHVLLVPARVPPHRATRPTASATHRFAMVALAAEGHDGLVASELELHSTQPSYTAVTLKRLGNLGYTPLQLFFITGADAFAEIANWHGYPAVLDQAHFVVVARPGYSIDEIRTRCPEFESNICDLDDSGVSGSDSASMQWERPMILFLRATTPDVSSREIRRCFAAGEPVAGLVSPDVESYIRQHRLYGPFSDGN